MKKLLLPCKLVIVALLFTASAAMAQTAAVAGNSKTTNVSKMKTYLIERELPDAGKLTSEQLKAISQTSCIVLKEMGSSIEWLQSYVTGNKIYCIYRAENEELIREHAKRGKFPVTNILEIASVISPATAR